MKKRKIEKIIFGGLMILPFAFVGAFLLMQLTANKGTGTLISINDLFANFSTIMSNFNLASNMIAPVKYLFYNIFELNENISIVLGSYIIWLVLCELLYTLFDFIVFLPRALRTMINRGV